MDIAILTIIIIIITKAITNITKLVKKLKNKKNAPLNQQLRNYLDGQSKLIITSKL